MKFAAINYWYFEFYTVSRIFLFKILCNKLKNYQKGKSINLDSHSVANIIYVNVELIDIENDNFNEKILISIYFYLHQLFAVRPRTVFVFELYKNSRKDVFGGIIWAVWKCWNASIVSSPRFTIFFSFSIILSFNPFSIYFSLFPCIQCRFYWNRFCWMIINE